MLLNARYVTQEGPVGGGIMGATGYAGSKYCLVKRLAIGDWELLDMEIMAFDMTHLEGEYAVEIYGLIGFRHLIHYDWAVDYAHGRIRFWERFVRTDHHVLYRVATTYRNHLPMVDITIAGTQFSFLVDTGASMVLLDVRLRDKVIHEVTDIVTEEMSSASATKATVESGTLSGFYLGEIAFGPHNIKFSDLSHMHASVGKFDGVIGYPLLSKHPVVVSWSYRSLYFLGE